MYKHNAQQRPMTWAGKMTKHRLLIGKAFGYRERRSFHLLREALRAEPFHQCLASPPLQSLLASCFEAFFHRPSTPRHSRQNSLQGQATCGVSEAEADTLLATFSKICLPKVVPLSSSTGVRRNRKNSPEVMQGQYMLTGLSLEILPISHRDRNWYGSAADSLNCAQLP